MSKAVKYKRHFHWKGRGLPKSDQEKRGFVDGKGVGSKVPEIRQTSNGPQVHITMSALKFFNTHRY